MMRRMERRGFGKALAVVMAAALLCIGGYAGRADATIWHVTNAADDPSNPAAGTLRDAINNAWNNDIIAIDFCDREIAMKSEIYIQKDITVTGYGTSHPTIVRQTTAGERVFRIKAYTTVRFEYLTITGGSSTATGGAANSIPRRLRAIRPTSCRGPTAPTARARSEAPRTRARRRSRGTPARRSPRRGRSSATATSRR